MGLPFFFVFSVLVVSRCFKPDLRCLSFSGRHHDIPALLLLCGSASAKGAERLGGAKIEQNGMATFEWGTHGFGVSAIRSFSTHALSFLRSRGFATGLYHGTDKKA